MKHRPPAAGLVAACHPGPAVVVTVFAAVFAAGVGAAAGTVALVTLAVLSGQLSVGWSNDWIDNGRDWASARADKPAVSGAVSAALLRRCALMALIACVGLSLATGWAAGGVHLAAVASAWSYNLVLKSTVFSWLPYAVSFGLLPIFVVLASTLAATVAAWTVLGAALLGVGAHVANTLPDLQDDRRTGVSGLPHRIGPVASRLVAPVVLAAATAVIVLGPERGPGVAGWLGAGVAIALAIGAGLAARLRAHSRMPFTLSMAVAGVCVILLVLDAPEVAVSA